MKKIISWQSNCQDPNPPPKKDMDICIVRRSILPKSFKKVSNVVVTFWNNDRLAIFKLTSTLINNFAFFFPAF
jgi:hypothetical protein